MTFPRDTRLKSLAGFGKNIAAKGLRVYVVTIDNLVEWRVKSVSKDGKYCTVINDLGKTKKYRKTRVYLMKTMAQLRFVRDTDKYFKPISEKFNPSINEDRIVSIRRKISVDEPAWFV